MYSWCDQVYIYCSVPYALLAAACAGTIHRESLMIVTVAILFCIGLLP